jgi:catechol 2,3-dioxygenase
VERCDNDSILWDLLQIDRVDILAHRKHHLHVFISNDRAHHRIALLALPGLRDDPEKFVHTGIHHTAFEYDSFVDLMSSFGRLKQLAIETDHCLNHGVATSLYYFDPDRNLVELQADNFGDWDASAEWMRSSDSFRQNPRGAFFDPNRVFAAYQAGATFEQLQRDTYAGIYHPSTRPTYIRLRSVD